MSRAKCVKHGHELGTREVKGLRCPNISEVFRAIAFNVSGEQDYCKRWFCSYESEIYNIKDGSSIQTLTMPSRDMERLEECRIVWKGQYGYYGEDER